jgi:hypothetical protein
MSGMIVVRFATLGALVFWLGVMTAGRFAELIRRPDLVAYACGGAMIVGLFVMKFVGPPPAAFVPRVAIVALMLGLAVAAGSTRAVDTAAMLVAGNTALGVVLLTWYVRE